MEITINGDRRECEAQTIAELVRSELRDQIEADAQADELSALRGFAVAQNGNVVRRAEWERTLIGAGDRIEIIRAYSGG